MGLTRWLELYWGSVMLFWGMFPWPIMGCHLL